MNKKSGWRTVGTNAPIPMTDEEYKIYRKKMLKWGMFVDKMKTEKPKFNKKPIAKETKEN